jgi:uncharacterized protein (DUF2141 family)
MRFRWQGRGVTIEFPEALRANTTYRIQIEVSMRDFHSIALKAPITFAFSTGATINRGEIVGHVLDAFTGKGVAQTDIFAYQLSDTVFSKTVSDTTRFAKREPDYRIQTDDKGTFKMSYLPEASFFVVAVKDKNRNRRLDASEAFAVPAFKTLQAVAADTTQPAQSQPHIAPKDSLKKVDSPKNIPPQNRTASPITFLQTSAPDSSEVEGFSWVMARADSTRPALRVVRAISSKRISVQFTEEVFLKDAKPALWTLTDSTSGRLLPIRGVYQQTNNRRFIWLQTDSLALGSYALQMASVQDSSGNTVRNPHARFGMSTARADTTKIRFMSFAPEPVKTEGNIFTLTARQFPQLIFNQAVDSTFLAKYLTVSDTSGVPVPYRIQTEDGTRYSIVPQPKWAAAQLLKVSLDASFLSAPNGSIAKNTKPFTRIFRALPPESRGTLVGSVEKIGNTPIIIELYEEGKRDKVAETLADASGLFRFRDLHEGNYRLRAYQDRNLNFQWDMGALQPYSPAEPIVWTSKPIQVRARRDETMDLLKWLKQ